jgi:hypothetical protein
MFGVFFASALAGAWLHADLLTGLGFCVGAVLAVRLVRGEVLHLVVVMPPAIFVLAVVLVQVCTAQGKTLHSMVLSVIEGSLITLADGALWLFGGMAASVALAFSRGLLRSVTELRTTLRASRR